MSNSVPNLLVTFHEGVRTIKFNRPSKKNAINQAMYVELANILNNDAIDDKVVVTIFTGIGDYFCSGNDIKERPVEEKLFYTYFNNVRIFIDALIDYPKILIAVVNGPAIGIGVTMLALCDVAYASDRATFATPFVHLGLCPEACSSYFFPRIMGRSKASQLLLMGDRINAQEAYACHLISKVIPHEKLGDFTNTLHKYKTLSVDSIKNCKKLVKESLKINLNEVNAVEMATLEYCVTGRAVADILKTTSKL